MQVITADNPNSLAAAIPTFIGFMPTESVVLVCVTGANVACMARLDVGAASRESVEAVQGELRRKGVNVVAIQVFVFTADDSAAAAAEVELSHHGVVTAVWHVKDGSVVGVESAAAPEVLQALGGFAQPEPSRAAFAARVQPDPARQLGSAQPGDGSIARIIESATLADDDLQWLVANLHNDSARDHFLVVAATCERLGGLLDCLVDAVTRVDGKRAIPLLTITGAVALMAGNSVIADAALERAAALPTAQDYLLLKLLQGLAGNAVVPETFRSQMAQLAP